MKKVKRLDPILSNKDIDELEQGLFGFPQRTYKELYGKEKAEIVSRDDIEEFEKALGL